MAIVIIYLFMILLLAAIVLFLGILVKSHADAQKEAKYFEQQSRCKQKFHTATEAESNNSDESTEDTSYKSLYEDLEELLESLEELRAALEEMQRIRQEYYRNSCNNNSNRSNSGNQSSNGNGSNQGNIRSKEAYEIFKLTPATLTEANLKKSYRELVKQYHPDRNKASNATERFQKIQLYYALLQEELKAKSFR